jgi:peptidoglycan L-alanyl-D-glutamate endopeptidase CwlK
VIEEFTQETSISRINTLHPKLVKPAMDIYTQCISDGFPIHIVCGKRTEEEQAVIYKYGRTIPGDILTPNRPGYSPHNYGLALDFCLYYAKQMQTWEE